jgi:hypothetical protein
VLVQIETVQYFTETDISKSIHTLIHVFLVSFYLIEKLEFYRQIISLLQIELVLYTFLNFLNRKYLGED